jgi:hypothetical protein
MITLSFLFSASVAATAASVALSLACVSVNFVRKDCWFRNTTQPVHNKHTTSIVSVHALP